MSLAMSPIFQKHSKVFDARNFNEESQYLTKRFYLVKRLMRFVNVHDQ